MASVYKRKSAGRSGKWTIKYTDEHGRWRTRTGFTDKDATQRLANKLEADAKLRREGVVDGRLADINAQAALPVESHLADYAAKLKAADRSPKHVATTVGYIHSIAESAEWGSVGAITADDVHRYAGDLRDRGCGSRTVGAYITAIKGFTKWLAEGHKLLHNPLAGVSRPSPDADRKRRRRMLLPEEWAWLRSAIADADDSYGMSGRERVLLYATAVQTGLRSAELRSLTRGRLNLTGEQPYITCRGNSTKNRRDARQYIRPELAEALREHVGTKSPKAPVFAMPEETSVAAMLRADLSIARKAWLKAARHDPDEYERRQQSDFLTVENHDGEHLDFHSLRHTCGAWLAMQGAHPKAIQSVMRHSTITLTMDTYGHLFPGQEADTIARLPVMLGSEPAVMRATGTDDAEGSAPHMHQIGGTERHSLALAVSGEAADAGAVSAADHGKNGVSAGKQCNASSRTRTLNPLIKSQLLCQLS